jgi:hypothetical protein
MVAPSISFVYGDMNTQCTQGSACDYLLDPMSTCTYDGQCTQSGACRDSPGGKHCAVACGNDLDCPSFQCQQSAALNACGAAAACTKENTCGIVQFFKADGLGGPPTGMVATAQPVIQTPIYLLIKDYQDNGWSAADYTLAISVVNDPDANEPNNFYEPFPTLPNVGDNLEGDILNRSASMATKVNWTGLGVGATVSGSGCIAYEGDIDLFQLVGGNPCFATGMGSGNCGLQLTFDHPMNNLNLAYVLRDSGLGTAASIDFMTAGADTVFGDDMCKAPGQTYGECVVYRTGDSGDYFLEVRVNGSNAWDTNPAHCYHWSIKAAAAVGCPTSCMTVMGNCTC